MRLPWGTALAPIFVSAAFAQAVPPVSDATGPVAPLSRPLASDGAEAIGAEAIGEEPEAGAWPMAASPRPRPEALRAAARPEPGWTLRAVPDGSTLALAGGPGRVVSLAAFCLGGAPWLALTLQPPPEATSVRAGFGFAGSRIEAEALREDGAGGAFVVELADGPLAGLLAGTDSQANLAIDGTQQGALSLAGSSVAIRKALEGCPAF